MGQLPDAPDGPTTDDRVMSTSTDSPESFQVTVDAAEAYEADFVPALFAQWAPALCAAAGVAAGRRVLDVACGTGIVARTAAAACGPDHVVGVDLNEAMLTVARRVCPDVEWRQGDVAALPFPDRSFDIVLCQMALMFFPDCPRAMREMTRVTSEGGAIAVVVPANLDDQPAYGPLVEMIARHAGPEARSLLSTYFACGDLDQLVALFEQSGLRDVTTRIEHGTARFPSVDALLATEMNSTPLGERITPEVYATILAEARRVLAPFTSDDGALEGPFVSHIVAAQRPARPR
jgi:ubiquinone/menaquinone biosynthesis C-methylase UbiE